MVVTNSECDENNKFSVEIDFNFDETGQNGFQILGNGNNYGTFQYADLPVSIDGLTGNCEIEYEFIVRDVDDPTCANFVDFGTVCCDDECQISIFDFETTECQNNVSFGLTLNLEYDFVGDDGYSVSINEESYGTFSYEDLPLNIDDIVSEEEGLNVITVCDNDQPECCDTYTFLNPCVCGMTNITTNIVDCSSTDSTYFVIIDFDHVATNDSFQMGYSNNNENIFLGIFTYDDLPITAGPIFLSDEAQEILIADTEDFFCFSTAYLGIVEDCNIECQLFNVVGEAYMCEEGEYFIDVEFDGKDLEGSTFEILVDGISYGTFEYGESFYTVGPIPSNCDTAPVLIVQDSGSENCSDFYNFPDPICCLPDCNFTSFEAEVECGPNFSTIIGTFENNGINLSGFYFVQFMGTAYGPFFYGDFTFSLEVPPLANGEYEISINDGADPKCNISTLFTSQCDDEPCIIFDVFAEPQECEEDQFFVDLEFNYAGQVSDSFEILGNGMNYGTFAYGEQFYTVGPLEGDCETIYEFVVSDQILEGCNSFYAFDEPICCSDECNIRDIEIIDYQCLDEANVENITFDFVYENPPSPIYRLIIDGNDHGSWFYSDLPQYYQMDLPDSFVIQILDSQDEECQATAEIELDCVTPDCTISDIEVEFVECDENDNFYGNLNFEYANTGDSFIVTSGSFSDTANYSELPLLVGPFPTGLALIFTVVNVGGGCASEDIVLIEDCETSLKEAAFSNIKIGQSGNLITIENNESEELKFQFFNISGALVSNLNIRSNHSNVINTLDMPRGLYFLNISNGYSQKTMKLIVY